MSTDDKNLEQVEAEVVEEGAKAVTMEEVGNDYAGEGADFSKTSNTGSAGTHYEQTTFTESTSKTFSIISLILGIFSVICCCTCWGGVIAGVASIIFGIIGIKNEPTGKTMAIIGIVCGGLGTLVGLAGLFMVNAFDAADRVFDNTDINNSIKDMIEGLGEL